MDSVVLLFCKCNEVLFRDNSNQLRERVRKRVQMVLCTFLLASLALTILANQVLPFCILYSLLPITAVVQLGQVCY